MLLRKFLGTAITVAIVLLAVVAGRALWLHYMDGAWTRDGRVRAEVVTVAPDVSGQIVRMPVHDNQLVKKGDLLMEIDPSHFQIAVEQAQANVAARAADLRMRREDAARRADMDSQVVSKEARDNAVQTASTAVAQVQQAQAELDAAKLNLERTKIYSPVDGYVTNLNVFRGDYATAGVAKLAVIDMHSFWVYAYFEETKLPHVRIGDKARIRLMSGTEISGEVESISRGIFDRDNPESRDLLADVNPTFNWVRLAQRVPVRLKLDDLPAGVVLSAGTTCTVVIPQGASTQSKMAQFFNDF